MDPNTSTREAPTSGAQSTSSTPIEIAGRQRLETSDMDVDVTGIGNLTLGGKKARRKRRGKSKLQNTQSFSSSLPSIRTSRDVIDARAQFATPSVTDARPMFLRTPMRNTLRRQSAVEPPKDPAYLELQSPVADLYCEEYNMNHPRRGIALILNHVNFETEERRDGSSKDSARLSKVLTRLGFEVRIENDLTFDKVLQVLRLLAQENHSLSDCLLVAVLTHGSQGTLFAYDHTYEVDKLWMYFTADKCPSLAGKPKVFVIQACRGERFDPGTVLKMSAAPRMADAVDASGGSIRYAIPNHADIIIANATIEGFYAWRNPTMGSWFIQTLCDQLELHSESRDLQTILTFTACRVAVHYESDVPRSPLNKMKQIPSVLSMLTRLVYFRRKSIRI